MAAKREASVYRIYLLTVWQEQAKAEAQGWRFHLTDPQTGERYGFTSPATLLAALQGAMSHDPPAAEEGE